MSHGRALLTGMAVGAVAGLALGRLAERSNQKSGPGPVWWIMRRLNPRVISAYRPDSPNSGLVLVLTTTGRKTGRPHVTPLQYEDIDGVLYVASARGRQADWFRNIEADPRVTVEAKDGRFRALSQPITDPVQIADFLEVRRQRHPRMIRAMLLMHGLSPRAGRDELIWLARKLALVALRPEAIEE